MTYSPKTHLKHLRSVLFCLSLPLGLLNCSSSSTHSQPSDDSDATSDTTAPVPQGTLSLENIRANSIHVSWEAATDDTSSAAALEYRLLMTTSDTQPDSVEAAEAQSDEVMDWTADIYAADATALSHRTTYYFALLVRDQAGNTALYPVASATTPLPYLPSSSFNRFSGFMYADQPYISVVDPEDNYYLMRLTTNGSVDTSFDDDGVALISSIAGQDTTLQNAHYQILSCNNTPYIVDTYGKKIFELSMSDNHFVIENIVDGAATLLSDLSIDDTYLLDYFVTRCSGKYLYVVYYNSDDMNDFLISLDTTADIDENNPRAIGYDNYLPLDFASIDNATQLMFTMSHTDDLRFKQFNTDTLAIDVDYTTFPADGGAEMLAFAQLSESDVLVMGAYPHGRLDIYRGTASKAVDGLVAATPGWGSYTIQDTDNPDDSFFVPDNAKLNSNIATCTVRGKTFIHIEGWITSPPYYSEGFAFLLDETGRALSSDFNNGQVRVLNHELYAGPASSHYVSLQCSDTTIYYAYVDADGVMQIDTIEVSEPVPFNAGSSVPWIDGDGNYYIADSSNCVIRKVDGSTGTISTVAGTYAWCDYSGDGLYAPAARLNEPYAVATDSVGNLYIADSKNNVIRKVDAVTHVMSTFAGGGATAPVDGPLEDPTDAALNSPYGITVDADDNVYIADTFNQCIEKISAADGSMTVIAGTDSGGFSGDGDLAVEAQLSTPTAVLVDVDGNVYISDSDNKRVRKIDADSGEINTIAGSGVYGSSGDNIDALEAQLKFPIGLAFDSNGDLLIADAKQHVVRKLTFESGILSTVAGVLDNDASDNLMVPGPALERAMNQPSAVGFDSDGNMLIIDALHHAVRKVDTESGDMSTVVGNGTPAFGGDGGPASSGVLNYPSAIYRSID